MHVDAEKVAWFCREIKICRLAFFGSVLRDDFGPGSDVDVLEEFEPGARIGHRFIRIRDEIGQILGRRVDLLTPSSIRPAYREHILTAARDYHVAA